jgi:hypothetical protein
VYVTEKAGTTTHGPAKSLKQMPLSGPFSRWYDLGMCNAEDPENDYKEKEPPPEEIRVTLKAPSFSLLSDRNSLEDEGPESDDHGIDLSSFLG